VTEDFSAHIVMQVARSASWPETVCADRQIARSFAAIREIAPQSGPEAMLAAQMIAVNDASLMFLHRATQDQYHDAADRDVVRASRLMRIFLEQLTALQKLRGRVGEQKVSVEHVHVHTTPRNATGKAEERKPLR
jgi:hypothetical protein